MPAVALTDHGSLAGAVELYREARREGVKPVVGCEVYVADDRRAQTKGYAHLTLLAETNEGYANLIKLCSLGYLEGYYYKPRVDWELLDGHAKGLVALSGCLSGTSLARPRRGAPRGRSVRPRPPRADLRARLHLRRAPERRARGAKADQPEARRARGGGRPAARRHRGRPLPRRRGRVRPRGASLHPVGRHAQEPRALALRHERVLLQDARGDGGRLHGARARARAHARDRGTLLGGDRPRQDPAPEVPRARRARRLRLPRRAVREGPSEAVRQRDAGASRAAALRAQDGPRDGLRRLLPDRVGLHPLREAERDQRRSRPRLLGRVARRLLPRDHRRRPDPLRPPLRAVPEPGPERPAGHGHRLLGRRARPGHQLRRREVRARPRRPDHHVLDDGRPGGHPGRRPGARHPLRRRRPDREARAGRARPDARGLASSRS